MKGLTNFRDLEGAFFYVNDTGEGENVAYLCLTTGKYHFYSEVYDEEEALPDDLEDSDDYIAVPHKNDLDLGKRLVLTFVGQALPNDLDEVDRMFRSRGAYRRFRDLL